MNVLVTGAAGRVGANVVRRLSASGVAVRAMVMPGDLQAAKIAALRGVELVEADLSDRSAVDLACRGATHVIHLAAYMVPSGSTERFYEINAMGTLRLLESALRSGVELQRFVLASSDGTYRPGAPPEVPLTEDSKQEPADYYGTSKLLGEVILRNHAAQFDIPYSIVRFATVVSPEEAANFFKLRFLRAFLRIQELGRKTHVWHLFRGQPKLVDILDAAVGDAADDTAVGFTGPDGQPWTLSMVDVRDAAQGVCLALTEPRALGRAFNIAAARPTTHDEGAAAVAEMLGVEKHMVRMPVTWRLELSIEAARRLIGFEPRYEYRDMLRSASADGLSDADAFIPAQSRSGAAAL